MKTIVHIVDTLCMGGRENSVIDICNKLDKKKHNVFVVTLTDNLNDLVYKLDSDVTFYPLPFKHKQLVGFNVFFSFLKISTYMFFQYPILDCLQAPIRWFL